MNKILMTGIVVLTILVFSLSSCNKENSCYDDDLYQQHKDDICTTDCPGVVGCDGKTYCNECEAMRNGISIE